MGQKKEMKDVEELSYEEAYDELITITQSLESEEHTLDENLVLFERGHKLSRHCQDLLNKAELKIKTINGNNLADKGPEENGV